MLAIFVCTPVGAQMEDRQAMMNLVLQVQQLQDEVRMLRGMLEDQTLELESLSNRQRDQYLDLDQRITELRGTTPGPMIDTGAAMTAGAAMTGGADTMPMQEGPEIREDVPEVRGEIDTPSTDTAESTPLLPSRVAYKIILPLGAKLGDSSSTPSVRICRKRVSRSMMAILKCRPSPCTNTSCLPSGLISGLAL